MKNSKLDTYVHMRYIHTHIPVQYTSYCVLWYILVCRHFRKCETLSVNSQSHG